MMFLNFRLKPPLSIRVIMADGNIGRVFFRKIVIIDGPGHIQSLNSSHLEGMSLAGCHYQGQNLIEDEHVATQHPYLSG
jgi:hypothetical protein